jgi:predicted GNAT family acetyltransferase
MAVRDNPALHRFELDADGETAVAYYRLSPGLMTFTHTEVAPALRGRGIGSALVRGALEAARSRGLKVVARCAFVSGYLARHPEYADLIL